MSTILVGIVVLRLNAFLALITAAIVVSLLAPGEPAVKIARVAEGFGRTAGTVGIVIALAAIIGKAMMDSGAADRIVNAFLALLGVERGATALCATGYVLSIPVFFDTVFYLLVPLARSMHGLIPSLLAIVLPVLLISTHTIVVSMTPQPGMHPTGWSALAPYTAIIGNPNLALLVSAGVAMRVYARHRGVSRADLAEMVDTSLMSAGVMILIIAASGGFGVALQATGIGPVIERAFVGHSGGAASGTGSGLIFLFLGFGV